LMNLYRVVQKDVEGLIEDLKLHRNEKEYFYEIRQLDRDKERYNSLTPVQRASRMIYLNKTCYNGLYRVNKSGQFNTPFGRYKNPNIVNEEVLRAVHDYFQGAEITLCCTDFEIVVEDATEEDFVYFDPPYDPVSDTAFFTDYAKEGFNREEQRRLKATCDRVNEKGVRFLLSNSATDFIKNLYEEYHIEIIQAKRAINSKANKRGAVDEVLVMNY
ncbi:MAG: Dam family site-specific DNA-(adenine-N6)-methyltransferase, partial [Limnochordia bacterium]|nr:Dam family site-specific DNA-(adenine-N6)-methyltransferase [Limnochordia bacterium]